MRISYWSSDVCSSDLASAPPRSRRGIITAGGVLATRRLVGAASELQEDVLQIRLLGRHVDHREAGDADSSEERRVGKRCVSTCRTGGLPVDTTNNDTTN